MTGYAPLAQGDDENHLLVDVRVEVGHAGVPRVGLTRYSMDAVVGDVWPVYPENAHSVVLEDDVWTVRAEGDPHASYLETQRRIRAEMFRVFGHTGDVGVSGPSATPVLAVDAAMCRTPGLVRAAVAEDGLSCLVGVRGGHLGAGMVVTVGPVAVDRAGPVAMYPSALYGWLLWQRKRSGRAWSWQELPAELDLVEFEAVTRVRLVGRPGPWADWPVRQDKPAEEMFPRPLRLDAPE